MEELLEQQAILARQQVRVRRLLNLMGVGMATVIILFVSIITYIVLASQGNRETTCALIETSRAEKRAQLEAFEETPPTTEVGRSLQDAYRDSLAAWDQLWDTIGCKAVPPPPS